MHHTLQPLILVLIKLLPPLLSIFSPEYKKVRLRIEMITELMIIDLSQMNVKRCTSVPFSFEISQSRYFLFSVPLLIFRPETNQKSIGSSIFVDRVCFLLGCPSTRVMMGSANIQPPLFSQHHCIGSKQHKLPPSAWELIPHVF